MREQRVLHGKKWHMAFWPASGGADFYEYLDDGGDAVRFAAEIQSLRDEKDFSGADKRRRLVEERGFRVMSSKSGTHVVDGKDSAIARRGWTDLPSYAGYAEWVRPAGVHGRRIIDICYNHESIGGGVHSYQVANWQDHPNLDAARAAGLPDTLWTAAGQAAMASAKSSYWFEAQLAAIEKVLVASAIRRGMAVLEDECLRALHGKEEA